MTSKAFGNTLLSGLLAICAALTLGCDRSHKPEENRVRTVAIATLMTHPALDTIVSNMKQNLSAAGYQEGKNIRFVERNANGDQNQAASIVGELNRLNPDVLVAITTPCAQSATKTSRAPIVFSAVTDPVSAGVVPSLAEPGARITGVSDAWPYKGQLNLVREILPQAKRLGVLFNPGEAASQYGIARIRDLAPPMGFEIVELPVSNSQEIVGVLRQRLGSVDALYLSSDNTVISGVSAALKQCLERRKPLFVGDSGTVEKGGLAAVSVGYSGVGQATGKLVARVLEGKAPNPVVVLEGDEIYLNLETAKKIGLTLPPALLARATRTYPPATSQPPTPAGK